MIIPNPKSFSFWLNIICFIRLFSIDTFYVLWKIIPKVIGMAFAKDLEGKVVKSTLIWLKISDNLATIDDLIILISMLNGVQIWRFYQCLKMSVISYFI